tara:strand:+ start:22835 stop:23089 length:255 start_codon:yes stop_codon:yes gene_type:complete
VLDLNALAFATRLCRAWEGSVPKLMITFLLAGFMTACATPAETATTGEDQAGETSQRMVRRCETMSDIGSNRPRRVCEMVPADN